MSIIEAVETTLVLGIYFGRIVGGCPLVPPPGLGLGEGRGGEAEVASGGPTERFSPNSSLFTSLIYTSVEYKNTSASSKNLVTKITGKWQRL
jgi:hypothetical protein